MVQPGSSTALRQAPHGIQLGRLPNFVKKHIFRSHSQPGNPLLRCRHSPFGLHRLRNIHVSCHIIGHPCRQRLRHKVCHLRDTFPGPYGRNQSADCRKQLEKLQLFKGLVPPATCGHSRTELLHDRLRRLAQHPVGQRPVAIL